MPVLPRFPRIFFFFKFCPWVFFGELISSTLSNLLLLILSVSSTSTYTVIVISERFSCSSPIRRVLQCDCLLHSNEQRNINLLPSCNSLQQPCCCWVLLVIPQPPSASCSCCIWKMVFWFNSILWSFEQMNETSSPPPLGLFLSAKVDDPFVFFI